MVAHQPPCINFFQHRLGQPASFAFANVKQKAALTQKDANSGSVVSSLTTAASTSSASKRIRHSTAIHVDALEQLNRASQNFEQTAARLNLGGSVASSGLSRLDKLQLRAKAIKDMPDFHHDKGQDHDKFVATMARYEKIQK
jgi:hypothetical protein